MQLFRHTILWLLLAGAFLILSVIVDNVLTETANNQDISFYDTLTRRKRGDIKGIKQTTKNPKSKLKETPKQRPWGTEIPNWDWHKDYTLHLDKAGKNRIMESNKKLNEEVYKILEMMVKSGQTLTCDKKANKGTILKSGKLPNEGVRLDIQGVDGNSKERQYCNYQIQKNGKREKGKPSSLAEFHLEMDKSFDASAVRDAVLFGMEKKAAVWLSAKENTTNTNTKNKKKN